ncbi:MAG: transglycosylase family protein [Candidatus Berkelbacteria bacterium]|nr:transglycosylase family protein [Candidatus Berkelbacteria bacterium]
MKRFSAFVVMTMVTALSISGVAQADYTSEYDYNAQLATDQTLPVKIEKTKINVPEISLAKSANVLEVNETCDNQIKFIPGESNVDRQGRLVREEAERQAQAEAQAQAEKAAKVRSKVRILPLAGPALGDAWYQLRMCESGNTYERNSGNGYYGAYQFNMSTWRSNAPDGWQDVRPDQAPAAVQDQAALNLYNARGFSPWPGCSRKLGLR